MVGLRMGFDGPGTGTPILTERQACGGTRALAENGADGIVYNNCLEAPRGSIEWIKPQLSPNPPKEGVGLAS